MSHVIKRLLPCLGIIAFFYVVVQIGQDLKGQAIQDTAAEKPVGEKVAVPEGVKTADEMIKEQQELAKKIEEEGNAALADKKKGEESFVLTDAAKRAAIPEITKDATHPDVISEPSGRAYALEWGLHNIALQVAAVSLIGSYFAAAAIVAAFVVPEVSVPLATIGAWASTPTGAALTSIPVTLVTSLPAKLVPKEELGPVAKAYHALFSRLGLGYWRGKDERWYSFAYVLFENHTNFLLRVSFLRDIKEPYVFFLPPQEKNELRGIGGFGVKMVRIEAVAEFAMARLPDGRLVPVRMDRPLPPPIFARRQGLSMVTSWLAGLAPYVNEVISTKIGYKDGKLYLFHSKGIYQDDTLDWKDYKGSAQDYAKLLMSESK